MTHPRRREQPRRWPVGDSKKTRVHAGGICERSGKRRFPSERDAVKAAAQIKQLNPHKKRKQLPVHHYQCRMCGDWHLTNMLRPEPIKAGDAED
jgi:hypothetical protein